VANGRKRKNPVRKMHTHKSSSVCRKLFRAGGDGKRGEVDARKRGKNPPKSSFYGLQSLAKHLGLKKRVQVVMEKPATGSGVCKGGKNVKGRGGRNV